MSSVTFQVKEMLRSYSKVNDDAHFFDVVDPDELIEETFKDFWNFNAIDYWKVFNNSATEEQQQEIDNSQAKFDSLNEQIVAISTEISGKQAELERAEGFVTDDVKQQYVASTNGKVEALKADISMLEAKLASLNQALKNADINLKKAIKDKAEADAKVDAANRMSLDEFEKAFLERFYIADSKYETPGLLKLQLKSWWRANMPLYSKLLNQVQGDIFITNYQLDNNNQSNRGSSNSNNFSTGWNAGDTVGKRHDDTLNGTADTPQNRLDLDVHNVDFASQIGKTDTTTDSNDHTTGVNHSSGGDAGSTNNESINSGVTKARNAEIFAIVQEWTSYNYNIYLDIFAKLDYLLFSQVLS